MTTDQTWIAVYTKPQREIRALSELKNQDYDVFLPTYTERGSDKVHTLYKRYLFCDVAGRLWGPIRNTTGVSDVIMGAGTGPARVRTSAIEYLQRQVRRGIIADAPIDWEPSKGEMLKIIEGCGEGLIGAVIGKRPGEVNLRLDMHSQSGALWVATDKCGAVTSLDRAVR